MPSVGRQRRERGACVMWLSVVAMVLSANTVLVRERPAGQRPFATAVFTLDDIVDLSAADRASINEQTTGRPQAERVEALLTAVALLEARDLGAAQLWVKPPGLKVEEVRQREKHAPAITAEPVLFVEYFARKEGGPWDALHFDDRAPPDTCHAGLVSTFTATQPDGRHSRRRLFNSAAEDLAREGGALTNVRIVAGPVAGRQLVGDVHPPLSSEACDGNDVQAPVQRPTRHRQATLIRRGGHFYARLVVNGVDLGEALVDTGASVLVLPAEAARRAGLRTTGTARMNTANGSLIGQTGTADDVLVAGLRVQAVETVVVPDGIALIGMTALAPFSIALEGTRMTLTAR